MAELTLKRRGEYIQNIFKILSDHPEGLRAKDVLAKLAEQLPPTPFEKQDFPNYPGERRFEYYVRFTTIMPVKSGWMTKSKGLWTVTAAGKEILKKFKDPEELGKENGRLWKIWHADHRTDEKTEDSPESVPGGPGSFEEFERAEEIAWLLVTEHLQKMPPFDFQTLVATLLRAMGYHVDWVAPAGPDEGVDIIAYTDPLGANGPRLKVQVKRRADRIGSEEMRSFLSVLGDNDRGLYVATGGFTSDAQARVRGQEKRQVTLIDLEKLFDPWVKYYDKIEDAGKKLLPLKPIYHLAIEN